MTVKPLPDSGVEAIENKDMWNGPGIQEEIDAWAAGISSGKFDQRLSPQEALMDLKVVSFVLVRENRSICANTATIAGGNAKKR